MLTQFSQDRFLHDIERVHQGKLLILSTPPGYRPNDGEMVEAGQHLELQLPEKMTEVVVAKVVERKHRLLKLEYPVNASATGGPMNTKTKWFLYTDPHLHHLGWHRDQRIWNGGEWVQITGPVAEQDLPAVPREAFRVAKDHKMQHGAIMVLGNAQWTEFKFVHVSEDSSPDGCWFFLQHGTEKLMEENGEPAFFHIEDERLYSNQFCLENMFPSKLPNNLDSDPGFHDIETYKEFLIDTLYIDEADIVPRYGCGLEKAVEQEAGELEEDSNLNFLKVLTFDESGEPLQKAAQVDSRSGNALILKVSGENSDRYVHVLSPWLYPPTVDETFDFLYTDTERFLRRVALPPRETVEIGEMPAQREPTPEVAVPELQGPQQHEERQEPSQREQPARRQSPRDRDPMVSRKRGRSPSTDRSSRPTSRRYSF